jgi:hypothetical protein
MSPPDAAEAPEGAPTKNTLLGDSTPDCRRVRLLVAHALELLEEQPRLARVELGEALRLLDGGRPRGVVSPTSLPFDVHEATEKLRETVGAAAGFEWALRVAAVLMP